MTGYCKEESHSKVDLELVRVSVLLISRVGRKKFVSGDLIGGFYGEKERGAFLQILVIMSGV